MKFKISEGTETYARLAALWIRMMEADAKAYKLVQQIRKEMGLPYRGSGHNYAQPNSSLAGGILAIQFDMQPAGWKLVGDAHQRLYAPLMRNKALWKRIRALPKLELCELNDIVGFKKYVGFSAKGRSGMVAYRAPGMQWVDGAFLMEVPENSKYTPPNGDIVEILESEYNRLAEAGRKKSKMA